MAGTTPPAFRALGNTRDAPIVCSSVDRLLGRSRSLSVTHSLQVAEQGRAVYETGEEPASGRRAAHVVAWLSAREEVENALREPLGGLPSQQDETASRMAGPPVSFPFPRRAPVRRRSAGPTAKTSSSRVSPARSTEVRLVPPVPRVVVRSVTVEPVPRCCRSRAAPSPCRVDSRGRAGSSAFRRGPLHRRRCALSALKGWWDEVCRTLSGSGRRRLPQARRERSLDFDEFGDEEAA